MFPRKVKVCHLLKCILFMLSSEFCGCGYQENAIPNHLGCEGCKSLSNSLLIKKKAHMYHT